MAVMDATMLMCFLRSDCPPPTDPRTNKPVEHARERIQHLISQLKEKRETIVIPAPALAEAIVRSGNARSEHVKILGRSKWFQILPFGERAAVEFAIMADSLGLQPDPKTSRNLVKFDMQILAITKVENQSVIYSDDDRLANIAKTRGVYVVKTYELPLPPESEPEPDHEQILLDFPEPSDSRE